MKSMEKVAELNKLDGSVYCTIYLDAKNHLVMDVWEGSFGTQDNFKHGIIKVLTVIKAQGCTRWIADIREMKGSFDSSANWLYQDAVPKGMLYGLRKAAIIWPKNVFSKLSTKDAMKKLDFFEIRAFDNPIDTFEWILPVEEEVNS